ncbi:MAG: HAMP domain-containing sensor histidine kinase [Kangiellaceae bacterium]
MIKLTTLSSRLTLWYSGIFSLFLAINFAVFYFSFESVLLNQTDEDLIEDIEEFQQLLEEEGLDGIASEIRREQMELSDSESSFVRILDRAGTPLYTTNTEGWSSLVISKEELSKVFESRKPVLYDLYSNDEEDLSRAMYAPINDELVLHIAESMEEKEELIELIQIIILSVSLIGLPIASAVGWLMSRKATKGINAISKIAKEIEINALDNRVSAEMWGDEIKNLANTFNAMLDRIRDLIVEMRELTDNVAHDLRSPLTRIRVIAESALSKTMTSDDYKDSAADIIDECDRLMEMINASLDLAELESGAAYLHREKINFTQMIEDACEFFTPLAEEKNIVLIFEPKETKFIRGDVQKLQRMLANLLDNAIKYTNQGGSVKLNIAHESDRIRLTISDTGIGIPESEQAKVFDRFYRCDQARLEKGCGLGLNFARAVAVAHGGEISLSSTYKQGSSFSVSLRV